MLSTVATVIILITLVLIISSLGYALYHLLYDKSKTKSTVVGLTVRIALSMLLFIGILLAIYLGWIVPNPVPI